MLHLHNTSLPVGGFVCSLCSLRYIGDRCEHATAALRLCGFRGIWDNGYTLTMTDDARIQRLRRALNAHTDIVCAYLFGSAARGEARPDSDLDLAVLLAGKPTRTLEGLRLDLADGLAEETGQPIDLVVLDRAPPDLVHRVLRDGILLLDRDPSARIRFEVNSRNVYFDLLPFLRRYRRSAAGEPGSDRS